MRNYLQEYYNNGDEAESIICDASDEIAELKRQLEEAKDLAKRCHDWGEERRQSALDACEMAMQRKAENEDLHHQLAESQAREARLREELEINCGPVMESFAGPSRMRFYKQTLALPHDDTALREYRDAVIEEFVGKFKRHVGGDGEFWMHELEDFYQNTKAP